MGSGSMLSESAPISANFFKALKVGAIE